MTQIRDPRGLIAKRDYICPKCGQTLHTVKGAFATHVKNCDNKIEDSFWPKVNKSAPGGCWLWTASQKEKGYGQFLWKNKMHRAHRLAWVLSGRELPAHPLELCHTCDNRLCVNPDHLIPGTHAENMAQSKARKRHVFGERNKHAKMTEAMAREILTLYKKTSPRKGNATELSKRFGVSAASIASLARGASWAHLHEEKKHG